MGDRGSSCLATASHVPSFMHGHAKAEKIVPSVTCVVLVRRNEDNASKMSKSALPNSNCSSFNHSRRIFQLQMQSSILFCRVLKGLNGKRLHLHSFCSRFLIHNLTSVRGHI